MPRRDLRLIPSDERHFGMNLAVFSYAEIEYGAERGNVAFRLFALVVFIMTFRLLVIVALTKRQARS
ncbi:unnamed protein product [Peronospora belbahrii]|uniref:CDR ABC transporter domain-containing protein n=1 Tax=Peronospora belbahrii TaxID=622444 RepID=A0ABN8CL59_9STRA|nr:unnamed protein product [Peronospora belbahrii]